MEKLIKAALAHARQLRNGARATEEEAERWERLATSAQEELARLLSPHRD
jgi:hypothetical protein